MTENYKQQPINMNSSKRISWQQARMNQSLFLSRMFLHNQLLFTGISCDVALSRLPKTHFFLCHHDYRIARRHLICKTMQHFHFLLKKRDFSFPQLAENGNILNEFFSISTDERMKFILIKTRR